MTRSLHLYTLAALLVSVSAAQGANVVIYADDFNDGTDDFASHAVSAGVLEHASAQGYATNVFTVPAGVTELWLEFDQRWEVDQSMDGFHGIDDNSSAWVATGGPNQGNWDLRGTTTSTVNDGVAGGANQRWDRFRFVYDFQADTMALYRDDDRDGSGFVLAHTHTMNAAVSAQQINDLHIWGLDGGAGATDNLVVTAVGVADPTARLRLGLDFDDGTPLTQPGFVSASGAGVYSDGGITATVAASGSTSVFERAFNYVNSTGANTLADGTMIGNLAADHLFQSGAGANFTITLSGLSDGKAYASDLWFADVLQNPGAVFQLVEFSDDGGSTWITLAAAVDPAGLAAIPVTHTDIFDLGETWVYRVTENNNFNQNRLNAFAIGVVVPTPAALPAGLVLLTVAAAARRRRH